VLIVSVGRVISVGIFSVGIIPVLVFIISVGFMTLMLIPIGVIPDGPYSVPHLLSPCPNINLSLLVYLRSQSTA
jgi:hypothetical protein